MGDTRPKRFWLFAVAFLCGLITAGVVWVALKDGEPSSTEDRPNPLESVLRKDLKKGQNSFAARLRKGTYILGVRSPGSASELPADSFVQVKVVHREQELFDKSVLIFPHVERGDAFDGFELPEDGEVRIEADVDSSLEAPLMLFCINAKVRIRMELDD